MLIVGESGTGKELVARELHRLGHAHSVEVYDHDSLVGGIYGVAIGRMFFGESMYSGRSGASKAALAGLAFRLNEWEWPLIDAQVERLGARRSPCIEDVEEAARGVVGGQRHREEAAVAT